MLSLFVHENPDLLSHCTTVPPMWKQAGNVRSLQVSDLNRLNSERLNNFKDAKI